MDSAEAIARPSSHSSSQQQQHQHQRVALIAGVTGIVGGSLVDLLTRSDASSAPWKVYGIARRPRPHWLQHHPIHYIQCDLLNHLDAVTKLSPLSDVTHLFYVTWTSRDTEEENCKANAAMLRNALEPLLAHSKGLQHVCLQTGIKHYIGSHFGFDGSTSVLTYHESFPRLPETIFYYVQEDLLFEALSRPREGKAVTWSVHRPGLIFGFSPNSLVNSALALAVYASICKHEGTPLVFTGTQTTWESHLETSDANLIAEQEIWAATHPHAHNQAFNVSNGDDVTWKELWPVVAHSFGIKAVPFSGQPLSFVDLMKGKEHVWEAMVKEHGLYPMKLADFLGGWQILDVVLLRMPTGKSSMQKSKEFGFSKGRATMESLLYWFERMREKKIIPN